MSRMRHTGPHTFLESLSSAEQARMFALGAQARKVQPAHWLYWRCGDLRLGLVSPQRAVWLRENLLACTCSQQELVWHAQDISETMRSEQLQAVLIAAREQGLLGGWRNERFSFWNVDCESPDPDIPAFLRVERSGFRWLGMLSHAVHVNGFLPDGRLWCARRALSKATDPGMLDNVTAGGLPSGETVHDCLVRELVEEAGLINLAEQRLKAVGTVRTSRLEPQGWHDEIVHVFNLSMEADLTPQNQDGEVAEFMCLEPQQVLEKAVSGAFTVDAVQTLLQGLRYCA